MAVSHDVLIAYFAVRKTRDNSGYVGGILVIDSKGLPQEFHSTSPLRPTIAQRALYGRSLEPYAFNELIGVRLLRSLKLNPEVCFVESPELFEIRESSQIPVIHLAEVDNVSPSDDSMESGIRVSNTRGRTKILVADQHPNFDDLRYIQHLIETISDSIDLLEPFDRVETALRSLPQSDQNYGPSE